MSAPSVYRKQANGNQELVEHTAELKDIGENETDDHDGQQEGQKDRRLVQAPAADALEEKDG